MYYLIDGHNLIGHCRTIRLGEPDDEAKLIDVLHRWVLRYAQHQLTVVFDHGVYGHPQSLDRPGIRPIFAYSPQDADTRLIKLIERATPPRQYRVVSSDRVVVAAAQTHGISVVSAAEFATQIEQPRRATSRSTKRQRIEPKLPRTEVDRWLAEFGATDDDDR